MREATKRSQARALAERTLRHGFKRAQGQKVEEQRGLCACARIENAVERRVSHVIPKSLSMVRSIE